MAKNENTSLDNNHTLYLATSGWGKSQTLMRKSGISPVGSRVLLWDNNRDHQAHQFDKLGEFAKAVSRADKSGRGFRLAYTGDTSPEAFEIWSAILWEILDGNKITYGMIEEYSDCCPGAGALSRKTNYAHRRLWTQSRKYGGILHATSQLPQLISKDSLGNAGVIWGSYMDTLAAKRIASEMDISADDLRSCQKGEFYYRKIGSTAERIRVFTPPPESGTVKITI